MNYKQKIAATMTWHGVELVSRPQIPPKFSLAVNTWVGEIQNGTQGIYQNLGSHCTTRKPVDTGS